MNCLDCQRVQMVQHIICITRGEKKAARQVIRKIRDPSWFGPSKSGARATGIRVSNTNRSFPDTPALVGTRDSGNSAVPAVGPFSVDYAPVNHGPGNRSSSRRNCFPVVRRLVSSHSIRSAVPVNGGAKTCNFCSRWSINSPTRNEKRGKKEEKEEFGVGWGGGSSYEFLVWRK